MDSREARAMARTLLDEHGLHDWRVVLDRAKTRAGVCRFGRREIGLSAPFVALHSPAEVRETVLHEVAHALVGPTHGHDRVWRATALRIGSTGERCVAADAPRPVGDWLGTCPAGHEVQRHRAPRRVQSCSRCSRRFDPAHLLAWTHRGAVVPMPSSYAAELRRLQAHLAPAPAATGRVPGLGERARITASGRFEGAVGVVEATGPRRLQVRVGDLVVMVPVTHVVAA